MSKHIKIFSDKQYIPLNIRNKHQFKESEDLSAYSERAKGLNTINKNILYNNIDRKRNKKEIKTFFIGNTNINHGIQEYK